MRNHRGFTCGKMNRRQYIKDAANAKKFPGPGTYEYLSDFPVDIEDYKVSKSRMSKTGTLPKIKGTEVKTEEKKEVPPMGS